MIRKKAISVIAYIVCLSVILTLLPVTAWAKDNNPEGNTLDMFPTAQEESDGDVSMVNNNGTINTVTSKGRITNNYGTIGSFQGESLEINCQNAMINEVLAGTIYNNQGTIEKTSNQGRIETNAEGGRIVESGTNVNQNLGTIEYQFSGTVSDNYASIDKVSQGASVSGHHNGTIGENNGSVTVTGEHTGNPQITNNNGTVTVKSGAKCTVVNNNSGGKIIVEAGGSCEITGECAGEVEGNAKIKKDGKIYYKLNFDNADISKFTFDDTVDDSVIKIGNEYFVLVNNAGSSNNSFLCQFDTSKYCAPGSGGSVSGFVEIWIISGKYDSSFFTRDDDAGSITIHFHTYDSYAQLDDEHKTMYPDQHNCKCSCGTEFALESCSGGEATCVSKATCEKCSAAYGNKNPNNHKHISDSWQNDSPYHWKECNDCNAQVNKTAHTYGAWITDTEAKIGVAGTKHRVCTACNYREDGTIPALKKEDGPTNPDNPSGGGNSSGENTEPENGSRGNSQQTVNPAKGNPTVIDVNTNATVDNSGNKAKAANNSATDIKKISPEEQNAESNDSTSNNGVDDEIIEITYNPDGTEVRNPVKTAEQVLTKSDNDTVNTKDGAKTSEQIENPKKSHTKAIAVAASVVGVTGAASGTWLFLKKRRL